jgi:hypothetical protein
MNMWLVLNGTEIELFEWINITVLGTVIKKGKLITLNLILI